MEHINQQSIDLVNILLSLVGVLCGAFVTLLYRISNNVIGELKGIRTGMMDINNTLHAMKEDYLAKHANHETEIAVLKAQMQNAVERRKGV